MIQALSLPALLLAAILTLAAVARNQYSSGDTAAIPTPASNAEPAALATLSGPAAATVELVRDLTPSVVHINTGIGGDKRLEML